MKHDLDRVCCALRRQTCRRNRLRVGDRRRRWPGRSRTGRAGHRPGHPAARRTATRWPTSSAVDLSDPGLGQCRRRGRSGGGPVDALFNVAGVSSGIGDPLLVVADQLPGYPAAHRGAVVDAMPAGSAITNVSSLAASAYLENMAATAGLLDTATVSEGIQWCGQHPEALADGGYRLSKEAIILYGMRRVVELGARGIRINCTAPGVTETPILDQLRSAYGQQFLDSFSTPLGRVSDARRTGGGAGVPRQCGGQLSDRTGDLGRRWHVGAAHRECVDRIRAGELTWRT